MARILVTGATGFIGKALCIALTARDNEVYAFVRSVPLEPILGVTYYAIDLTDFSAVQEMAREIGVFSATVHLAARIPQGATSSEEMYSYAEVNIHCLTNFLAAFGPAVGHFVYVSSIDVYGNSLRVPYQESQVPTPATVYGGSKLAAEGFVHGWASEVGVTSTVLRLSQVYGSGESIVKVLPQFLKRIRANEPLLITGGGADLRRYLAREDAIESICRALDARTPGTFNVAGEEVVSIMDVIHLLEHILGRRLSVEEIPGTSVGNRYMAIDCAREVLGFVPKVSLEEGLRAYLVAENIV